MAQWLNEVNFNGGNGSHFYLKITYDLLSQSIENNTSTVRYYEYVGSRDGYSGSGASGNGYINGSWVGGTGYVGVNSEVYIGYLDQIITHNADGTKTTSYSAYYSFPWNNLTDASLSGNLTLPTIPRYFSENPKITVNKNNETSFTCTWTTSENCNQIRYSLNNGSSWTTASTTSATSGSFNINSLTANTTYNIKFEFRRADSSLTTVVSAQQTTYSYPYISTITPGVGSSWNMSGSSQTVGATLYNPLGRTIKTFISISTTGGTKIVTFNNTTGTSVSVSLNKSTINNAITTAQSAVLVYWCQYTLDGTNYTTSEITKNNTYQLREADCRPTISNLTYDDGNLTTKNVIGNNGQTLVQNYSILKATVGNATYQYGATFKSMNITLGSKTVAATIGTAVELGKFNYSSAQTMTATITDSRGWTHSITKSVTFIAYQPPQVSVKTQRTGGYGTNATFTVDASYTTLTVGGVQKNAWLNNNSAYVRYSISPTPSTPAATGNVSNTNPITNVTVNITGADNTKTYTITIYANDKITSATATATFGQGQPILGIFKDNQTVGINTVPASNAAAGLYISGVSNLNGTTNVTGNTTITGNLTATGNLTINGKTLLDWIHPIGSIYESTNSTSPATLFGGTWEEYGSGRVLVGRNANDTDFDTIGETGGSKEMQKHSHIENVGRMNDDATKMVTKLSSSGGTLGYTFRYQATFSQQQVVQGTGTTVSTDDTGTGTSGNLQPYIVIYRWRRTA